MVGPIIFQIVGYQNSGKTTLLNKLIQKLTLENYSVATIKHHGHGGKPDINENKDSSTFIQSGACVSLVEGEGRIILQAEKKENWTINDQISKLTPFELDFIFIEGHKYAEYPKAVIINNEPDITLLQKVTNIKVVFFREKQLKNRLSQSIPYPNFHVEDEEGMHWLIKDLKSQ